MCCLVVIFFTLNFSIQCTHTHKIKTFIQNTNLAEFFSPSQKLNLKIYPYFGHIILLPLIAFWINSRNCVVCACGCFSFESYCIYGFKSSKREISINRRLSLKSIVNNIKIYSVSKIVLA